jgi:hypothetical protein
MELTNEQKQKLTIFKNVSIDYKLDNDNFLWVWFNNRFICFNIDGSVLYKGDGNPLEIYPDKFKSKVKTQKPTTEFTWFFYNGAFFQVCKNENKEYFQDVHGRKVHWKKAIDLSRKLASHTHYYSREEVIQILTGTAIELRSAKAIAVFKG